MADIHQFARADWIARHARAVLGGDRAARSGAGRYHADSVGARAGGPRGGERIRAGAGRPAHTPRECPAVHPDRRAGTGRRRSAASSRRRSHEPGSHAAPAHKPDHVVSGAVGRGAGGHLGSADVAARRVHSSGNGGRRRGRRRVDRGCRWRPSRGHRAGDLVSHHEPAAPGGARPETRRGTGAAVPPGASDRGHAPDSCNHPTPGIGTWCDSGRSARHTLATIVRGRPHGVFRLSHRTLRRCHARRGRTRSARSISCNRRTRRHCPADDPAGRLHFWQGARVSRCDDGEESCADAPGVGDHGARALAWRLGGRLRAAATGAAHASRSRHPPLAADARVRATSSSTGRTPQGSLFRPG